MEDLCDETFSKKVAVYTCISDGYDKPSEPLYKTQGFDYYLFSDSIIKTEGWNVCDIPENIKNISSVEVNRYIKIHPFELFPGYDYAIYVDGNVRIVSDLSALPKYTHCKSGLAFHRHVLRDCIYQEGEVCILYGKGNSKKIRLQLKHYLECGFPTDYR